MSVTRNRLHLEIYRLMADTFSDYCRLQGNSKLFHNHCKLLNSSRLSNANLLHSCTTEPVVQGREIRTSWWPRVIHKPTDHSVIKLFFPPIFDPCGCVDSCPILLEPVLLSGCLTLHLRPRWWGTRSPLTNLLLSIQWTMAVPWINPTQVITLAPHWTRHSTRH